MGYSPITPFRRTMTADDLKRQTAAQRAHPSEGVNKWDILRALAASRHAFDLSDRDLSVLQALVSFHPATILGSDDSDLVVFPSNAAICERLNGMPCLTMRRHLARLVQAGILVRRDSPNGKRYARRYGGERVAFGFDLTPLVLRETEILAAAETARAAVEHQRRLRELHRPVRDAPHPAAPLFLGWEAPEYVRCYSVVARGAAQGLRCFQSFEAAYLSL